MGSVSKVSWVTANGTSTGYRARYRDPDGKQHAKQFVKKSDAANWLTAVEGSKQNGSYVSPSAGKQTFGSYAEDWRAKQTHRLTMMHGQAHAAHDLALAKGLLDRNGRQPALASGRDQVLRFLIIVGCKRQLPIGLGLPQRGPWRHQGGRSARPEQPAECRAYLTHRFRHAPVYCAVSGATMMSLALIACFDLLLVAVFEAATGGPPICLMPCGVIKT